MTRKEKAGGLHVVFSKLLQYQQLRFLLVGGCNTVLATALILGLQYVFNEFIPPQAVFAFGFFVYSIPSYLAMRLIVFKSHGNYVAEYIRYLFSVAINCGFSVTFLTLMVDLLKINVYVSHCLSILSGIVICYVLLKGFVFRGVSAPGSLDKPSDG